MTARVSEVVCLATAEALDAALAEKGIEPGHVIAVIFKPGMAVGVPQPDEFRVLYWTREGGE